MVPIMPHNWLILPMGKMTLENSKVNLVASLKSGLVVDLCGKKMLNSLFREDIISGFRFKKSYILRRQIFSELDRARFSQLEVSILRAIVFSSIIIYLPPSIQTPLARRMLTLQHASSLSGTEQCCLQIACLMLTLFWKLHLIQHDILMSLCLF